MTVPVNAPGNTAAAQQESRDGKLIKDLGPGHIMGNLTFDPELRYTPSGKAVCSIRLAYTPRVPGGKPGEFIDGETEFYTINVWGAQAERCAEHLMKGDRVVAAGLWQVRTWIDREGEPRESTELTARDIGPSLLFAGAAVDRSQRQHRGGNGG